MYFLKKLLSAAPKISKIHDDRHKIGAERWTGREQDASLSLGNELLDNTPVTDPGL